MNSLRLIAGRSTQLILTLTCLGIPIADAESIVFDLEWAGPETSVVEECTNEDFACFQYPIDGTIGLALGSQEAHLENFDSMVLVPPDSPGARSPIVWDHLELLAGEYISQEPNGDVSLVFRPKDGTALPPYELFVDVTDERSTLTLTGGVISIAASPLEPDVMFSVSGQAIPLPDDLGHKAPEPGSAWMALVVCLAALVARRRMVSSFVSANTRYASAVAMLLVFSFASWTGRSASAESTNYDLEWNGPETSLVEECAADDFCIVYPITGKIELTLGELAPSLDNLDSVILVSPSPPPFGISPHVWSRLDLLVGEYLSTDPEGNLSMRFQPGEIGDLRPYELFVDVNQSGSMLTLTGGIEQDAESPLEPDVRFFVSGQAVADSDPLTTDTPEPGTTFLVAAAVLCLIANRRGR